MASRDARCESESPSKPIKAFKESIFK